MIVSGCTIPAVVDDGKPLNTRFAAEAAFTVNTSNPVSEPSTVSVAVIVWLPADLSMTENTPTPLFRGASVGNTSCESVESN